MAVTGKRILVGVIVAAHGIKGQVKIKTFTQDPLSVARYGAAEDEKAARSFTLKALSANKDVVIASIKGVATRDEAEALAKEKVKLYVPRAQLPRPKKGQYYHEDLKGLAAQDETGAEVARVEAILNFGAGDIVVLKTPRGAEILLPLKEPFVTALDLKAGSMRVRASDMVIEEKGKKNKETEGEGSDV